MGHGVGGNLVALGVDLLNKCWVSVLLGDEPSGRHSATVPVDVTLGDIEDGGLGHDGDSVVIGEDDELGGFLWREAAWDLVGGTAAGWTDACVWAVVGHGEG